MKLVLDSHGYGEQQTINNNYHKLIRIVPSLSLVFI